MRTLVTVTSCSVCGMSGFVTVAATSASGPFEIRNCVLDRSSIFGFRASESGTEESNGHRSERYVICALPRYSLLRMPETETQAMGNRGDPGRCYREKEVAYTSHENELGISSHDKPSGNGNMITSTRGDGYGVDLILRKSQQFRGSLFLVGGL